MTMKAHEIIALNVTLLEALARTGIGCDDVRHLPLWRDYERLKGDGLKTAYIVAYLCDRYALSERTVYRIIDRFRKEVAVRV